MTLPVIARSACSHRPRVIRYNLYSTTLSPHWVPKDPSGVGSACSHGLKSPEWQYNMYVHQSVRTVVRPVVHGPFVVFCICINFQCGVPALQCIYPHTWFRKTHVGFQRTPVGSYQAYMSISLSRSLSVSLSSLLRHFLVNIDSARNFTQRMRLQAKASVL